MSTKLWHPKITHPFVLVDPGDTPAFFETAEECDKAAADAIAEHLDCDGWSDEVDSLWVGTVAAVAAKVDVRQRPDDLDESGCDGEGTYWGEFDELCRYELQAVPDPRDAEIERLRDALQDMLAGWRYIRETHGDLYGVEWGRAQQKAEAALAEGKE
jgi:hypothetical protein